MKQFKIRCSAIADIMAYPDANKLPVGAITYIEKWLKEQPELYNRRIEFSSKYTNKGKAVEDDAIDFASSHFNWGMVLKNDEFKENEFITGTPDLILADSIEDIKSSWSHETFPLFKTTLPDPGYRWQLLGYMSLFNKKSAGVVYCLMDAPDAIIDAEARKLMYSEGLTEMEMDLYDRVKVSMTYSNLADSLRIKRFSVERDDIAIKQIEARVKLCREHIKTLDLTKFTNTNKLKAA